VIQAGYRGYSDREEHHQADNHITRMLSPRTLSVMKWRTAFIAVSVLLLINYGPSWRKEQERRGDMFGAGRQLLSSESDNNLETGSGLSQECDGDECEGEPEGDILLKPSCDPEVEEGDKPVQIFKSKLKRYLKQSADPAKEVIICERGTKIATDLCNLKKENEEDPEPTPSLNITVDACRSFFPICKTDLDKDVEPNEEPDQMFPKDLFTEDQRGSGAILLHILGILYMFYALALVCDHYFVPCLDVIIEKFGISPDVAGATFMAAGGSAPELFTSIIGVFIAVSDVGIGTIVGSAVFNVLFVIAACAFASATALKLTAWPLIRDTTFYSIALIVLVIFFTDDIITWWEALILFLWYFAYVIFMKFNAPLEAKFLEAFPSLKKEDEEEVVKGGFYGMRMKRRPLLALMKDKVSGSAEETEMKAPGVGLEGLKLQLQNGDDDESKEPLKTEGEEGADGDGDEPYVDYVRAGPGDGIIGKIMWGLSLPLMIPMWITIPDPQDTNRQKFFPIAFFASIAWIAVFSYLMVWWATLAGVTLGISDAVMGLTFLAAGTSVPDLITSVLVAKEGKGDMAVSSSIGSNLFDVTVGLPVPWLLYTIIFQKPMEVNSVGMGCSIGMLFVMLLLVFISIMVFKWEMTKGMGIIMLFLYLIFVVISLGLSECWMVCPI